MQELDFASKVSQNSHMISQQDSEMLKEVGFSEDDIWDNEHLSCYSFAIDIKGEEINPSRFIVGTKTNSDLFEKSALNMLNTLNICPKTPNEFKWYGVGWDIKNDQIKIYFLKNDLSQIYCKEYIRSSCEKLREKIYDVGKESTKMHKDDETIDQVNSNNYEHKIVDKMTSLGFVLDTYSTYKNKVTLYFD